MAILADYVIPADKTPADLERDLEAMVSGITSLSLQAPAEEPSAGLASPTSASPPTASSAVAEDPSAVSNSWIRETTRESRQVPLALILGFRQRVPLKLVPWMGDHSRDSAGASRPDTLTRMCHPPLCRPQGLCRCWASSCRRRLPRLCGRAWTLRLRWSSACRIL